MTSGTHWWLSFSDGKSLGIAIIKDKDAISAIKKAHELGINPGGEVKVIKMDADDKESREEIDLWGVNRLVSRAELVGEDYEMVMT